MNATSSLEYFEHRPLSPLDKRVRCIWALRAAADSRAGFEPVFPDGCPELVLNLAEPFQRWRDGVIERQLPALLVGQLLEPIRLRPTGLTDIVGIRFHPWGLSGLRGVSPRELVGEAIPVDAAGLGLPPDLADRLVDTSNLRLRCQVVEQALLAAGLGTESAPPPGAVMALAAGRARSVSRAAAAAGVSSRHLERLCARWVGLAPHDLIQLARFQRALHRLRDQAGRTLTWIAHDSGFADQAHFSRDFTRFAGTTPSAFRASMAALTAVFIADREGGAAAGDLAD